MQESVIRVHPPEDRDDAVVIGGELEIPDGSRFGLRFRSSRPAEATLRPTATPLLLGFLIPAMRVRAPLRVEAPVDDVLLGNLEEFQLAMSAWRPGFLRPVTIACEEIRRSPATRRGSALTCFSGGVDSTFTALRHAHDGLAPRPSLPVEAALMVHGFDIPIDEHACFERAFARSRDLLAGTKLELLRMSTDLRALEAPFSLDWGFDLHGAALAASLSCYESIHSIGVIPSTYRYDLLRLPWGSNPITDPLLGSSVFPIVHDGAGFDKLDKVARIAPFAEVGRHLRVCWQGSEHDRNCGRCFKCMATHVCFAVTGRPDPGCFPGPLDLSALRGLDLECPQNIHLFEHLEREACSVGASALREALVDCLRANHRFGARTLGRRARTSMKAMRRRAKLRLRAIRGHEHEKAQKRP